MDIKPADYIVHFSNLLLLFAYLVRDILWLRWFAVAAAIINIPYYFLQRDLLWPPVLWALVFIALNLYQIARIYWERRPVVLSPDEQGLYDMGFQSLHPREFVSLLLAGEWRNAAAGERVLTQGKSALAVCIAIFGRVQVYRSGKQIGALEPGQIIGTAVALTGDISPVDAIFVEAARYMYWPLSNLRGFLDKKPDLRIALQRLVSQDIAAKLERVVSSA
jgi:hypothetical protein